jgi:trehalose 2-sulfotransferase
MATLKNMLEMSPERDFPQKTEIRMRYCILSSPRAGGTLLGRMLYKTGRAGDPLEYFNLRLLQLARERSHNPLLSMFDFLRLMEARRTSSNGVFGMKIQFDQMLQAFRSDVPNEAMVKFLRGHQCLLWIRRRNKLRQAISHAVAMHTNAWSSEDIKLAEPEHVPLPDCIRSLQIIALQDLGWEKLIEKFALDVQVIWYEELAAAYEKTCAFALSCLRLKDTIETIPPPPIKSQSGNLNTRLHSELVDYLAHDDPNLSSSASQSHLRTRKS